MSTQQPQIGINHLTVIPPSLRDDKETDDEDDAQPDKPTADIESTSA